MLDVKRKSRVMDTPAAASFIGCSAAALKLWRRQGLGPRFYRAGRLVRYRKAALEEWVKKHSDGGK